MSVRAAPSSRSRIVAYDLVRVVAIALVRDGAHWWKAKLRGIAGKKA